MNNRLKGILLLFALIASTLLSFIWLSYQKYEIKGEVRKMISNGIEEEELVLLKFTKEESETKLKWEHAREFSYKQKMYDIVESQIVGDSVFYLCWKDQKETNVNNNLKMIANKFFNCKSQQDQKKDQINNFYKSLYCQQNIIKDNTLTELQINKLSAYFLLIQTQAFSPPSPPPKA